MLVERSMLTMRMERSICPLTMCERSMLTMRIESSICPLTMLLERSNAYREKHLSERSIVPLTMLVEPPLRRIRMNKDILAIG